MSDAELWRAWGIWMAVATVVVAVAAGLLVTIWMTARRILADARRALAAAEAIQRQTAAIWQLQTSNEVAGQLLATVKSIEARAVHLAGALQAGERG